MVFHIKIYEISRFIFDHNDINFLLKIKIIKLIIRVNINFRHSEKSFKYIMMNI